MDFQISQLCATFAQNLRNLFGGEMDLFARIASASRIYSAGPILDFATLRNICATCAASLNKSGRIDFDVWTNPVGLILRHQPICADLISDFATLREICATFSECLNQAGRVDFEIGLYLIGLISRFRNSAQHLRNNCAAFSERLGHAGRIYFEI